MSKPRYSDGLAASPPLTTGFPLQPTHTHAPPPSPGWDPRDEVDVTVVAYPKDNKGQLFQPSQTQNLTTIPQQANIPSGTSFAASQQGLRFTLDDFYPIERLQPSSTVLASPAFSSFPTSSGVVSSSFPSGLLAGGFNQTSVANLNTTTGPSPLGFFGIPSSSAVTTPNWGNLTSFQPTTQNLPLNISTIGGGPSLGVDPSLLPLATKPIFSTATAQPSNFGLTLPPQITPNYSQNYVPPTNLLQAPTTSITPPYAPSFAPSFQPSLIPPSTAYAPPPPFPSTSGFTVGPRPPHFGSIPGPSFPPTFGPAYRPPPAGFSAPPVPFGNNFIPPFSARPQPTFGQPSFIPTPQPPKFLPTSQQFGGQYGGAFFPQVSQSTTFSQFGNQFTTGFSAPTGFPSQPLALPGTSARGPNDFLLDLDLSKYTQQFSSQQQNPGTYTTSTTSFTNISQPQGTSAAGPTFPLQSGQAFTQNPDGSWSARSTTELQKSIIDNSYLTSTNRSESPSPSTNREFLSAVDQFGNVNTTNNTTFFGQNTSQNPGLASGRSEFSTGGQSGYSQGGPVGGVSSLTDIFGNRPSSSNNIPITQQNGSVASQGPSYSNQQPQQGGGLGGILNNIGSQGPSAPQGFSTSSGVSSGNEVGLGNLLSGSVASQGPTPSSQHTFNPPQQQQQQQFQQHQQHQQHQQQPSTNQQYQSSQFGGAGQGFSQGPSASVSSYNGPSNYGNVGQSGYGSSVLSQGGYPTAGASVTSQIPGQGPQYRLPSLNRSDLGSISRTGNPLLGSTGSVHPLSVTFDDSLANDELLQYRLATLEREVDRLKADDEALRRKIANPNITSPHQNLLREKEALISKIREEERRWTIERQARESDMHRNNEEAERLKQQQIAYEQMRLAEAQYQAGSSQGVAAWTTPASAKKKKKKSSPKGTKSPKKSPKKTTKSPKK